MTCVILLNGEYEDDAYYLRQVDAAQWSWPPTAATPFCAVTAAGRSC